MRRPYRLLIAILLLLGLMRAQQGPNPDRVVRWQEDLKAFSDILHGRKTAYTKGFPSGQKDLEKLYPTLDQDLTVLEQDLPKLRDGEIHLRLARILAGAHIAHNMPYLYTPQRLPIIVEWLEEEPVITAAAQEYQSAIGTRLVKAGDLTADALLDALAPYISYETEGWKRVMAADWMRGRVMLETIGVARDGRADLTLEGVEGMFTLPVAFAPLDTKLISLLDALNTRTMWLSRSHPEEPYYWSQFLDESKTLYIQYNQCADDPKQPFRDFVKKTLASADERRARHVIVDLRFNGGGSSRIINPLVDGLKSRSKSFGAPYVLVGPYTFSSGVWGADDLRKKAGAKLVGSPTGGLRGGYGESPNRELPNSKFRFQWTIKNFGPERELQPDVRVAQTLSDLRAGRDTVLEAALSAP